MALFGGGQFAALDTEPDWQLSGPLELGSHPADSKLDRSKTTATLTSSPCHLEPEGRFEPAIGQNRGLGASWMAQTQPKRWGTKRPAFWDGLRTSWGNMNFNFGRFPAPAGHPAPNAQTTLGKTYGLTLDLICVALELVSRVTFR